jgi:DNA polymerase
VAAFLRSINDIVEFSLTVGRNFQTHGERLARGSTSLRFLFRQIASIRPKLIVTLGNPATQGLLETKTGITRLRGEFQDYPRIPGIKVLPTFHPAYLLRSPDKKREAWEDLKKVRAFLRGELSA